MFKIHTFKDEQEMNNYLRDKAGAIVAITNVQYINNKYIVTIQYRGTF
jgi:hypothetical protein